MILLCFSAPASLAADKPEAGKAVAPEKIASASAPGFKILKIERTKAGEEGSPSKLLRGKILVSFSKPSSGQIVVSEKEKDTKKAFPPAYEMHWVGEPESIDLENKDAKALTKYSRVHKHVGEYDTVISGETILTEKGTRANLLAWDGTELTLGQDTIVEFFKVEGESRKRIVHLKLLQGYLKVTVKTPLEAIGQFEIVTPNAYITPRGTRGLGSAKIYAFHVAVTSHAEGTNITTTSVLNLEGQLSIDYIMLGKLNKAFTQTQLLLPKQEWKSSGRHGLSLKPETKTLKPDTEENPELRLSTALLYYQGLR